MILVVGIAIVRFLGGSDATMRTSGRMGGSDSASPQPATGTTPVPTTESPSSSKTQGATRPLDPVQPQGPDRARGRVRVPTEGDGNFIVAHGDEAASNGGLTYTVEIEEELPFAAKVSARMIRATLQDKRGWGRVLDMSFRQVSEYPDLRILVATPNTTDALCAPLQTMGRVSCRNGDLVVLNARRWAFGIDDYRGNLRGYRSYLVNHEVGHALGRSHVECVGRGLPAPVMQQQTYGLDGCTQNPWPITS